MRTRVADNEISCLSCGWHGDHERYEQTTGGEAIRAYQVWCPVCGTNMLTGRRVPR